MGGTVRYAVELVKHWLLFRNFKMIIYIQTGVNAFSSPEFEEIPRREFQIKGGLLGRVFFEHAILPFVVQKDGVDLLFSPGFVSPLWGSFRKVVTIHDLYYRLFPDFVRPWQRRYWQIFIPLSMAAVDAVVADSDSTSNDVKNAFPKLGHKVKRVHLGANALLSGDNNYFDEKEIPYCLVVGNITPNKNIETVLKAVSLRNGMGESVKLVIAGHDPFGLLEDCMDSYQSTIQVDMRTHVSDSELGWLYANALCLIQASHYEGFGLPVIEAMQVGCPVIASDIPVMREIGNDAAIYFSPDSPNELSQNISRMLNDPALRQSLIEQGKCNAEIFSWEKTAKETAELFDAVLRNTAN